MTHRYTIGALVVAMLGTMTGHHVAAQSGDARTQLRAAVDVETVDGDARRAIELYASIAERFATTDREIAATALFRKAELLDKLRDPAATPTFEQVSSRFADQTTVAAAARQRLQAPVALVWSAGAATGYSISRDGRYMPFTDWATGDLALRDLTANTSRRLTNTGGWTVSGDYVQTAAISPDGAQVAYLWNDNQNQCSLRILPTSSAAAASPKVVRTAPCEAEYLEPVAWTPDGLSLVGLRSSSDRTYQIARVSLADGALTSVKSLEWRRPTTTSLSPDGRYVAYDTRAENGGPRDVVVLALDGTRETTVVSGPTDDFMPMWAPNGAALLFMSARTQVPSLWRIDIADGRATGEAEMVHAELGAAELIGFSSDGALFYGVRSSYQNVYVAPLDGSRVAQPPAPLSTAVGNSVGAAWSADGQSIAFYSHDRETRLVIRSVGTGQERTIPLPADVRIQFNDGPRWLPDGRSLVINRQHDTAFAFHRLRIDTGETERLHGFARASSWTVSQDGRSIFWTDQQEQTLNRYDIDTRQERVLRSNALMMTVAVSPDGKSLAYVTSSPATANTGRHSVRVMSTEGDEDREVYRQREWGAGRYNALAWAPDGRHLIITRDDNRWWKLPVAGGEPEEIAGTAMGNRIVFKSPAVAPDGRTLTFTVSGRDNTVWTLDRVVPTSR